MNFVITEIHYKLKSEYLHSYPIAITIEPGNICNLSCPLCPTGQKDSSANHGFMDFDNFKNIIDEIGKYLLLIRLYNWGEPTLNRDLTKMIKYATKRGIDVKISTNLSMNLSDREIESIINSNLKKIYISANGASSDSYLKYHIGGDFDKVINNIKLLIKKKKEFKNSYTELIWLFHVSSHNEHEIEKAKEMAKELGIRLKINKMRTDMGKEVFETAEDAINRDSKWLPKNSEYRMFDVDKKTTTKQFVCNLLWKETVLNWDGSIMPCCFIYSEKFAYGNIKGKTFKEIWNNAYYLEARKALASDTNTNINTTSKEPNKKCVVCQICKSKGFPFN